MNVNGEVVTGDLIVLVLGALLALGVVYWLLAGNEVGRLKDQYLRSVHLPRAEAEQSLSRHLARVQESHRTPFWTGTSTGRDRRRCSGACVTSSPATRSSSGLAQISAFGFS